MGEKDVKVRARVSLPKDSEESLVQRELLVGGMYLGGTDAHRGDVIEITEAQAERHDALGNTAEVGTIEKMERERAEAEQEAAERAEEQQRLDDEEADRRMRHAENRVNPNVDDSHGLADGDKAPNKAVRTAEQSDKSVTPDAASGDGPRTTRRSRG